MFKEEIKNLGANKQVLVLFDMDGTLVEYGQGEKPLILNNTPSFYLNKRKLSTTCKIVEEISKYKNVTVGIMSNCYFDEQKQDKITWLSIHLPFLKQENIYINVYKNIDYKKEEKDFIKYNRIKTIEGFDQIFLIEDEHNIIKATNKLSPNTAHHISELID